MHKMTLPHAVKWLDPGATIEGISAFVMIAESHISIHTFPEKDYVFMDVFSCKSFDAEKAAKKVKRIINKIGIADVVFLKPKGKDIQQKISNSVNNKDIETLEKLLVKKNFNAERLGRGYSVRVLTSKDRVTSIAVDKGGKVFMRSEKPRKVGGSMMVAFRTPTAKLSKIDRKVKV